MPKLKPSFKIISKEDIQSGFTLIEVMISMVILAIGILSVAAMQVSAITGNNSARSFSEATSLAQDAIERIILLDFTDTSIQDDLGSNEGVSGLDDGVLSKTTSDTTISNVGPDGQASGRYTIDINYADSNLYGNAGTEDDIKIIRLIVTWQDKKLQRRAVFDFIKARVFESGF